jgi:DNA-directed RNA polymerase beta' subunit
MSSLLILNNWDVRWAIDKAYDRAIPITNEVGIDRKTVKPIENGLYSRDMGNVIDTEVSLREFSCFCGEKHSKLEEGELCELCNTVCVEQFGQDLNKYGWIDLGNYFIIQPAAFELITSLIGIKTFDKMIHFVSSIGLEGTYEKVIINNKRTKYNNYENIGLIEFKKRFEEIISYYGKIKPNKAKKAKFLLKYKNRVFASKIPVYSTLLRPAYTNTSKKMFSYDKINSYYTSIINNVKLLKSGSSKRLSVGGPLSILYAIQEALQNMYNCTVASKLSGKTRIIRGSILSTRMSFSSRAVITSLVGKYSGMDHLVISYKVFIELYTLEILNCMINGICNDKFKYNTIYENLQYLRNAKYSNNIDDDIYSIIEYLIENCKSNMWVAVNRPPTMDFLSIQVFRIVHVLKDPKKRIMQIPLTSLSPFTGDFDGDCLSLLRLIEGSIIEEFVKGFNPRYNMIDPTGDNFYNSDLSLIKDQLTVLNSFLLPLTK